MTPTFIWDDPIEIEANRTCDYSFSLYKANGKPEALNINAKVRFKLSRAPDSETPLLDIDSIAALDGGSIATVLDLGVADMTPAQVKVRFHQNDTKELKPGLNYFGELGIVDVADGGVFKRAGFGSVSIKASPGGDVGAV
jgi:hypothetical protein